MDNSNKNNRWKVLDTRKGLYGELLIVTDEEEPEVICKIDAYPDYDPSCAQKIVDEHNAHEDFKLRLTELEAKIDWLKGHCEPHPKSGEMFYIRGVNGPYRWQKYKPEGKKQMGAEGRWQVANEYGGWENSEAPFGPWLTLEEGMKAFKKVPT